MRRLSSVDLCALCKGSQTWCENLKRKKLQCGQWWGLAPLLEGCKIIICLITFGRRSQIVYLMIVISAIWFGWNNLFSSYFWKNWWCLCIAILDLEFWSSYNRNNHLHWGTFSQKNCCSFGFFQMGGGGALPKFFVSFA